MSYDPRAINPVYQLVWGIRFFFSGLRALIRHPALFGYSLVPILSTIVMLFSIAFGLSWLFGELITETLGDQLGMVGRALIFLVALVAGFFLYLPLARVILAPFSEALSRKTHSLVTGGKYQSESGPARSIWEGLKLFGFNLSLGLIALALSLLFPPVGVPVGITIAIFICSLDFLDVPLSARGLSFRQKLGLIRRNKMLAFGFGLAAYLLLLVPVINLLSLPVGVIGATLLTDQIE